MPISARGNSRGRHGATGFRTPFTTGFTLLEVLVVLVIAGVLVSLASLTLTRNPRTDLIEQAQRLALAFETASDEAQVRAAPLAWQPVPGGYRFAVRASNGWRALSDELLGPARWQVPVSRVDILYPGARGTQERADALIFGTESIGRPVSVTLSADAGSIDIVSDGSGRFEVVGGGTP
jgi:general secretion pathway protein H